MKYKRVRVSKKKVPKVLDGNFSIHWTNQFVPKSRIRVAHDTGFEDHTCPKGQRVLALLMHREDGL
jgi:hypothetical protein